MRVKPGDDVTIYCDCTRLSGFKIVWVIQPSNEHQPPLFNLTEDSTLPHYSRVWNNSKGTYDLLVKNITGSELGLYYCALHEIKFSRNKNGDIIQEEIYHDGNRTTFLSFQDTMVPSTNVSQTPSTPPVSDCSLCWKLLIQLSGLIEEEKLTWDLFKHLMFFVSTSVLISSVSGIVVEMRVKPGDDVTIYCDCTRLGGFKIVWVIKPSHEHQPPLFHLTEDSGLPHYSRVWNKGTYDLLVKNITGSELGLYYCAVHEIKFSRNKNGNILKEDVYHDGNRTTFLSFQDTTVPCANVSQTPSTPPVSDCSLCWKLLIQLSGLIEEEKLTWDLFKHLMFFVSTSVLISSVSGIVVEMRVKPGDDVTIYCDCTRLGGFKIVWVIKPSHEHQPPLFHLTEDSGLPHYSRVWNKGTYDLLVKNITGSELGLYYCAVHEIKFSRNKNGNILKEDVYHDGNRTTFLSFQDTTVPCANVSQTPSTPPVSDCSLCWKLLIQLSGLIEEEKLTWDLFKHLMFFVSTSVLISSVSGIVVEMRVKPGDDVTIYCDCTRLGGFKIVWVIKPSHEHQPPLFHLTEDSGLPHYSRVWNKGTYDLLVKNITGSELGLYYCAVHEIKFSRNKNGNILKEDVYHDGNRTTFLSFQDTTVPCANVSQTPSTPPVSDCSLCWKLLIQLSGLIEEEKLTWDLFKHLMFFVSTSVLISSVSGIVVEMRVKPGDDVTIYCDCTRLGGFKIVWVIKPSHEHQPPLFHLTEDSGLPHYSRVWNKGTYDLLVKNITGSELGLYYCSVHEIKFSRNKNGDIIKEDVYHNGNRTTFLSFQDTTVPCANVSQTPSTPPVSDCSLCWKLLIQLSGLIEEEKLTWDLFKHLMFFVSTSVLISSVSGIVVEMRVKPGDDVTIYCDCTRLGGFKIVWVIKPSHEHQPPLFHLTEDSGLPHYSRVWNKGTYDLLVKNITGSELGLYYCAVHEIKFSRNKNGNILKEDVYHDGNRTTFLSFQDTTVPCANVSQTPSTPPVSDCSLCWKLLIQLSGLIEEEKLTWDLFKHLMFFVSTSVLISSVSGIVVEMRVKPGDDVTIYCDCTRLGGFKIVWVIKPSHEHQPPLFHLTEDSGLPHYSRVWNKGTYDLLVKNITGSELGLYYCAVHEIKFSRNKNGNILKEDVYHDGNRTTFLSFQDTTVPCANVSQTPSTPPVSDCSLCWKLLIQLSGLIEEEKLTWDLFKHLMFFVSTSVLISSVSGIVVEMRVKPGDDVTIYCDCTRLGGFKIVWVIKPSHEHQPPLFHLTEDSKLPHYSPVWNKGTYDLLVKNVTGSELGLYYCALHEIKFSRNKNGDRIKEDVYHDGNRTTFLSFQDTTVHCANVSQTPSTPPVSDCSLCWKLLIQLSGLIEEEKLTWDLFKHLMFFVSTSVLISSVSGIVVEMRVKPGDDVTIYCDCTRLGGFKIVWVIKPSHEHQPPLFHLTEDSKLPHYSPVWNKGTYDLLVKNITGSELGLYYCALHEIKFSRNKNGDRIKEDVYHDGNRTTFLSFQDTTVHCANVSQTPSTPPVSDCSLCWKLLVGDDDVCYASLDVPSGDKKQLKKRTAESSDLCTYSQVKFEKMQNF
ncbi:hypothetical protein MHYP_G00250190 [Metynnis hypsauchen]